MYLRAATGAFGLVLLSSTSTGSFTVDRTVSSLSTVVAVNAPRLGAPGYSWLRIYFYPAPLTSDDQTRAARGSIDAITARWGAVLQLSVDANGTVWQVDVAVPGHTCTVAATDAEARAVIQEFHVDAGRLRIRTAGSHVCTSPGARLPSTAFAWAVDVDTVLVRQAR